MTSRKSWTAWGSRGNHEAFPLARELYDEIAQLEIIDAHEHLPAEADYLKFGYSGLNLFANYLRLDLLSAGLDAGFYETMRTDVTSLPEVWWPKVKPFYEACKHTGYAQALQITARDLFDIDEINDRTIGAVAERVQADNTPGLYRRVLRDRCRIRKAITYVDQAAFPGDPVLCGITSLLKYVGLGKGYVAPYEQMSGTKIKSLDDLTHAAQSLLRKDIADGAVGFKMAAADFGLPDSEAAAACVKEELAPDFRPQALPALRDWLFDKCLDVAAEANVPVAVHTGYWGDFREMDPKFMLGFAARRPDVRFDMFHLGIPFWREAALIGKNLPNVTLNLCWCAIASPLTTRRMLDELIDLVPANKISLFGGDYRVAVQKVYGHLVLARRIAASSLAKCIEAGEIDRPEALRLGKLWLHDNPARFYGI